MLRLRRNDHSPSISEPISFPQIARNASRRCGIFLIKLIVLCSFPIGPFFLHSSRTCSDLLSRFLVWESSSNASASFPKRKAFAARLMICLKHLTRLKLGSSILGRSSFRIARIIMSLELALSLIKYPSRSYTPIFRMIGITTLIMFSPVWELFKRLIPANKQEAFRFSLR